MTDASIIYSLSRPIAPADVQALLRQTTWGANRDEAGIAQMMSASICIGAWDGDRLVGFARVLTDGVYRALLDDVVVDEAYRGGGIGAELVRHLLDHIAGVQFVVLATRADRRAFYRRLGFVDSTSVHMYMER